MDPKGTNPYDTEIPVEEAEKELSGPSLTLPTSPVQKPVESPNLASTSPTQPSNPALTPPPVTPPANTPPPPVGPPPKKSSLIPRIIIGVLVLLIVLLTTYIVTAQMGTAKNSKKDIAQPTMAPTATPLPPTATPTPSVATTSADALSNRFYSEELGIYFDYAKTLTESTDQVPEVKIDGSRVYLYLSKSIPSNGQYVDVLSKITTDSTLDAVSKITASDPNYKDCTFSFKAQIPYPETYEEVIPVCPPQSGAGLTFFLGDKTHPDKLLFFSIGQYSIPSSGDPQITWQDTLRFL